TAPPAEAPSNTRSGTTSITAGTFSSAMTGVVGSASGTPPKTSSPTSRPDRPTQARNLRSGGSARTPNGMNAQASKTFRRDATARGRRQMWARLPSGSGANLKVRKRTRHDLSVNPKLGVHAIVRHDPGGADVALAITVVAVVPTREEADREVERLQEINRHTG